jgi:glucose dehydrogenase
MRKSILIFGVGLAVASAGPASANESVFKATANPKNWAMQQGDYSNHRFSTLKQINAKNVGSLHTAWTFSTGVLRGHEGSPLVIGNMMYVHTPFPIPFSRSTSTTTRRSSGNTHQSRIRRSSPSCAAIPSIVVRNTLTA